MGYVVGKAKFQKEVIDFIKSNCNYSLIIDDKELLTEFDKRDRNPRIDIIIPELKLAIMCYDSWMNSKELCEIHSIEFYPDINLERVLYLNKKGYRVLNIWQEEWEDSNALKIIQKEIKDILQGTEDLNTLLNFTEVYNDNNTDWIALDYGWYNNVGIPGYYLETVEPAQFAIRTGNVIVPDCGVGIYIKINSNQKINN